VSWQAYRKDTVKEEVKGKENPGFENLESLTQAKEISNYLADKILSRDAHYVHLINGKREKTVSSWTTDINKINRIDKRDWPDVWRVVQWCVEDDFWSKNILSGKKLREKFSDLILKMPRKSSAISGTQGGNAGLGKRIQ
jgi:hypothetical protein